MKFKLLYPYIILFWSVSFFFSCNSSNDRKRNQPLIGDLRVPSKNDFADSSSADLKSFNGNYYNTFNDVHQLHMSVATKFGFSPMATRSDTSRMKGKIIYYKPNEYENFVVDSLPHSMPVMIPDVAQLIKKIGVNFRDSLKKKNLPDYKIIVTSITRTDKDIKLLRRRNRNAINESAHRFGTTFDITWLRFQKVDSLEKRFLYNRILKRTLAQVLYDLQQLEKCYIKYEQQQMCFHITVRPERTSK